VGALRPADGSTDLSLQLVTDRVAPAWPPRATARSCGPSVPVVLDLPALPAGLTVRPLRMEDAAAVAALLAVSEPRDDTGEHVDAEDLAEWWRGTPIDFSSDGLAVVDDAGELTAFAVALPSRTFRDAYPVYLEGRVRPDQRNRGVGRALLSWQLACGTRLHAERHPEAPGRLVVSVAPGQAALEGLCRRAGLVAERWYRDMERQLTDLPAVPAPPGGELVPWTPDRDDEVRRVHNAAFTAHHGSSERDPATWQALFTGQRAFRPDLSVLALADGVVVAYALAYVYEADARATGQRQIHFGQIGVLPEARGRGLAKAVIAEALRRGAANDCRTAGLNVDSDNVTGALRLYEGLGFQTIRTNVTWSLALPPAAGPGAQ
jgi:mycothiol synthase